MSAHFNWTQIAFIYLAFSQIPGMRALTKPCSVTYAMVDGQQGTYNSDYYYYTITKSYL